METKLHIIAFDIPYPPVYGGVIDIYFKLVALKKMGVPIILHCFQYGNKQASSTLHAFCEKVYYYPRHTGLFGLKLGHPYIISSRASKKLLENLLMDDHPILFEGIHTTYWANHPSLQNRKKILRAHNIEQNYYGYLAKHSTSLFKKWYFIWESWQLKKSESNLSFFHSIFSIAQHEVAFFKQQVNQTYWIPAFHSNFEVSSLIGKGDYCLYHGNLAVQENEDVATFLATHVFNDLNIPFIIAGHQPSSTLFNLQQKNIQIIANPDQETMQRLIQEAHIQVLPSRQAIGLKLKLLQSLFAGRFCIANEQMLTGSQLREGIIMAETAADFKQKIKQTMSLHFSEEHVQERQKLLANYNNLQNAEAIIKLFN